MEKLVRGFLKFRGEVFGRKKDLFTRLSQKQEPQALFITCSDSRVDPTLMTQAEPGELFILRNAGNMVPPYGSMQGGSTATIEYAMAILKVPHIIVCVHTDCGVMKGVLNPSALKPLASVTEWLHHARAARRAAKASNANPQSSRFLTTLTERNVVEQLKNLRTHPVVATRLRQGDLRLHGWVYHLANGTVTAYNSGRNRFIRIHKSKPHRARIQRANPNVVEKSAGTQE